MELNVKKEIAALGRMTPAELRQRHLELFGEKSRSGNRQWLFRRLAWRIQALAEGGLSERARQRAKELANDADVRVRAPRDFDQPASALPGPTVTAKAKIPQGRLPMPGAAIVRVFKGREHHVTVLPDGFEYEGERYRSLTAVAHKITGSHWNGYHFFGIRRAQ